MESITQLLEDVDFTNILPEIGKFIGGLRFWTLALLLAAPVALLVLGLRYYRKPVQEPSEKKGYRIARGMTSLKAWRFTQRTAAVVYMALGGGMALVSILLSLICLAVNPLVMMTVSVIWVAVQLVLVVVGRRIISGKVNANFDADGKPIR